MLARESVQLTADGTMTVKTEIVDLRCSGNFFGCVGIRVTGETAGDLCPVRRFMARCTFGHDGIIIPLARTIGVKNVMTALARKLVLPAIILQSLERAGMALCALTCGKRLRLNGILLRSRRNRNGCNLFAWCRIRKTCTCKHDCSP